MSRRMSLSDPESGSPPLQDRALGVVALCMAFLLLRSQSISTIEILVDRLRQRAVRTPTEDEALTTWRAVHWPSPLFLGRAGCFELALAVTLLSLQRRYRQTMLIVGVRMDPFESHAWVEVAGRPLNEPEGFIDGFRRITAL